MALTQTISDNKKYKVLKGWRQVRLNLSMTLLRSAYVKLALGIRIPFRVRVGSIRISGFRVEGLSTHSGIWKKRIGFGSVICGSDRVNTKN